MSGIYIKMFDTTYVNASLKSYLTIPDQVWSQTGGAYMNAKGYNNRCILGWLADCLAIVVKRDIPADRFVGAWIQSQVNANNMTWPMHEMLEPSAICLTLGLCNMTKLCQILSMVYRYRQKLWSQLLHFTLMPFHHLPPFPSSGMHSTGCF
jgi:hypothetical protein